MLHKKIIINNKLGLHARASAKFIDTAGKFSSKISVTCNGKNANGKSIMDMMLLAASKGAEIELMIDGEDEVAALSALEVLVANKFDEAE